MVFIGTRQFYTNTRWQAQLIDFFLSGGHDIAHRSSRQNSRDRIDTLTVFTLNRRRSEALYNCSDFLHSHTFSLRIINNDIFYILYRCAIFGRIHYFNIIFLSFLTELGSRSSIDTIPQISSGSRQVKSVKSQLLPVEIYLILGLIIFPANTYFTDTIYIPEQSRELSRHTIGLLERIAVDFIVQRGLSTHSAGTSAQIHL